jgi:chromosome segregation ATPase
MDHDDVASVDSSVPSTLYARCTAETSHALNARRLRQAVDADVKFLQNRLAKLRAEEQRAKAEVDSIKEKTAEVQDSKARHEATMSTRRRMRDQVDYGKRREAALIALNKERQAKAVWAAKQRVMQDRRDSVLSMRKQKEINECRVHILREEERDHHVKQRESIRQLHEMARVRRERESEARRQAAQEAFREKVEQEQREREAKEQLAAQLIAQEAQLIHRLKRIHAEKQAALGSLAEAVTSPSNTNSPTRTDRPASAAGTTAADSRLPPI